MRNFLIYSLLLVCFWVKLPAQTPIDSLQIEAFLDGIQAGKTRLVGSFGDNNFLVDSAMVDPSGHFLLRRAKPLPPGFYYFLLPGNKSFSILIDRDDQRFTIRGNASDFNTTMRIEGNGLNTDLLYQNFRFQNKQEPEFRQLNEAMRNFGPQTADYKKAKARQQEMMDQRKAHLEEIFKTYPNAFFTKFKKAGQNPDFPEIRKPNGDLDTIRQVVTYRKLFWNGFDFSDDRLLRTPVAINKLKRYILELTPQHPDSIWPVAEDLIRRVQPHKPYFQFFANWIALNYENGKTKVMDGEAVYVNIVKNFFKPELAFWSKPEELEKLQKHVWEMEASLMGRKGPDVRAQDINGEYKSIYEMKAPIVVVFMFSPDCEHCQEQAPKIEEIYKKWKDKGVDFFGISVNTTDEEWRKFIKRFGFTFTNVFDPTNRAIYAKYYVDITPELYILNPERTIVAKNLVADQLETIFERELRKVKKN